MSDEKKLLLNDWFFRDSFPVSDLVFSANSADDDWLKDNKNIKDLFMALSEVSKIKLALNPLETDFIKSDDRITINAHLHEEDLLKAEINAIARYNFFDDELTLKQEIEFRVIALVIAKNYWLLNTEDLNKLIESDEVQKMTSDEFCSILDLGEEKANDLIEKIDSEFKKRRHPDFGKTALQKEIEQAKKEQAQMIADLNKPKKNKRYNKNTSSNSGLRNDDVEL
ncbi:hypothetical protein ACE4W9_012785 [Enterococcus faecalis]|uniref:hypothetical protein n=1 Tax=Enterococcus TaxID=1350 RepID=UPI000935DE25|nr:hypothetical protein [Enterococcus faecium]PHL06225.1 hypothetical protein CQR42_13810 [Enterococcus faecium]